MNDNSKIAYTAVFEQEVGGGWAAYVPDLPTILVSADSRAETEQLVREAVELYVDLLREKDKPLPAAVFQTQLIEVAASA